MDNAITAQDVQTIYEKVEKTKRGTFFIHKSDKKAELTPNHIDEKVALYLKDTPKEKIQEDGKLSRSLIKGLIIE